MQSSLSKEEMVWIGNLVGKRSQTSIVHCDCTPGLPPLITVWSVNCCKSSVVSTFFGAWQMLTPCINWPNTSNYTMQSTLVVHRNTRVFWNMTSPVWYERQKGFKLGWSHWKEEYCTFPHELLKSYITDLVIKSHTFKLINSQGNIALLGS